ncbi:MAG: SpoIIE family protein phosphatase [Nostocoides sp.]
MSRVVQRAWVIVLVGAAYYLGARLGLGLSLVGNNVTPLWPPTGIAVAAFVLFGRSSWPGVAIAALAVNLPISSGPFAAAATAVGNTAAPLLAATLLKRVGFRWRLDRQRDALAIVFLAALASMLVSAVVGAGTLVVSGALPTSDQLRAGAVWWTGDAMGVLAVAPFLLSLPLYRERPGWPLARWLEAGAILVVTGAVVGVGSFSTEPVLFLTLPVLGWAAWRLQLRGAAPAALLASVVATWAAAHGRGPYAGHTLVEQMVTLQAFNACVALTSFVLAAMVSDRIRVARALQEAAGDLEVRVLERTRELSTANARLVTEIRDRTDAQEQLTQEEARAQREQQIATTLQRSLLPDSLPDIPRLALASRYVPATTDVQVGGDWYDVVRLPGGLVGLAIGDVAGHGLQAAATMAQVRMAVRAYALQDPAPISVMTGVHRLVAQLALPEMVTAMYLLFDPATRRLRFTNAGHPPALVVADGRGCYLHGALTAPLGVVGDPGFTEAEHELSPGATLLLYTDGLIERRGVSLRVGLERLHSTALAVGTDDVEVLCDQILATLTDEHHVADDIALLVMRAQAVAGQPLTLNAPAEARVLVDVRQAMRRWLRAEGVPSDVEEEILLACGEACSNVVQHAYRAAAGELEVFAHRMEDAIEVTVRDAGQWRPAADRGGGWGMQLMRSLMESVEVEQSGQGTVVRMRHALSSKGER